MNLLTSVITPFAAILNKFNTNANIQRLAEQQLQQLEQERMMGGNIVGFQDLFNRMQQQAIQPNQQQLDQRRNELLEQILDAQRIRFDPFPNLLGGPEVGGGIPGFGNRPIGNLLFPGLSGPNPITIR